MREVRKVKDLDEKERKARLKKLKSMIEEIDKRNYDATTTAIAQIMAIRDVWKDRDIDWLDFIDKIKKRTSKT